LERPDDQERFAQPTEGPAALRRMLRYARPYTLLIVITMVLAGGLSGSRYVRAYLMKPIFDEIILPGAQLPQEALDTFKWSALPGTGGREADQAPSTDAPPDGTPVPEGDDETRARLQGVQDAFGRVVLIAVLLVVLTPILLFVRDYTVQYILGRIDLDMKVDICRKLLSLPLRFHQEWQRGDVMQRILNDTSQAQKAVELLFGDFLMAVLMIVIGMGGLIYVSWKLSLILILVGPVMALVISSFSRRIRKSARRRQEQSADVTQRLVEIIAGIKIIKSFRAEDQEHRGFRLASRRLFHRAMKVVKNRVLARSLVDALNNFAAVGVMILGLWLVLGGYWGLTPGDLGAFVAMTTTVYKPIRTLARGYVKVLDALPSAERFFELLDLDVEIRDVEDAIEVGRLQQGICFRDVSFSYGREPVLDRVSLDVAAGEVVAIVGRTGAGKTTLTDLLLRLYEPDEGAIELDGVDIRRIRRDSLLEQFAVVTQEPFLFDGTIAENIRYGRQDASEEEILAAARAANVDEFVRSLPEGFETEVGAAGTRLSGGQRQRVTIARAILRDPAVLILDEATSSLDSKAERSVQEALEALLPGRTVFVIAHRLSTVRQADKIVVIEAGQIAQMGTHEELVASGGLYRELVDLQSEPGPGAPAALL